MVANMSKQAISCLGPFEPGIRGLAFSLSLSLSLSLKAGLKDKLIMDILQAVVKQDTEHVIPKSSANFEEHNATIIKVPEFCFFGGK